MVLATPKEGAGRDAVGEGDEADEGGDKGEGEGKFVGVPHASAVLVCRMRRD